MNSNDYLNIRAQSLTESWGLDAYHHLNKDERLKLIKDTQELFEKLPDDNVSPDLQEKIKNLRKTIFDGGFETVIEKKFPILAGLIKRSAGKSLHHLMVSRELRDLQPSIYEKTSLKDLLAMRQASKATKNIVEKELIRRINKTAPIDLNSMQAASRSLQFLIEDDIINRMNGAIGSVHIPPLQSIDKVRLELSNLNISTLTELRSFFNEEALKDLTYLDLALDTSEKTDNVSQLIAINLIEINKSCPNLKVLTLRDRPLLSTNTKSSSDTKSKKSKSKSASIFSLSNPLKKKKSSSKEKNNPLKTDKICPFKILELSYIKEIEGKKLTDLDFLKLCPELEQLSLEGCEYINNTKGLANCEKLTHLDIRNTFQIDNLEAAVHNCPHLEVVDIQGVNKIPPKQIEALEQRKVKINFTF